MLDSKQHAPGEHPAQEGLIDAVGVEQLADVFRGAGYRVSATEQNGAVQLMSASQGVGFAVRFGNALPSAAQAEPATLRYLDYTLGCVLQVQGDLPAQLVGDWNRTKRFARLASHGPFLALEMDVIVAGGVSVRYLRSTIELWDRMVQEFLLHLRNRPALAEQDAAARAASDGDDAQAGDGAGDAAAVRAEAAA
ncbi:YbjN domain-containing protein [Burkholderia stagnalis]|uniref:YbjN domain-containing protein n=1 Tax=Burkholderia stagnalis TaxID=1503054 RepID=UPI000F562448|nr:YbjN domain-containing protein [Burkholderia stagnalis]RQQ10762.1 YbjN domain-containing protein [Burkholderia stagnalis]RQQ37731.1 YbjN domain-containing protein [Burkholderia stagnalis]RQQ51149.1 YbjN domain-containing protein [Burkholderia stagnalis]RQY01830.1 YbjN domain-containing protein [Burkholderia stagnalis]RQY17668.1 YbjN domain-containing protein [Burkholderia stagnalis]